MKCRVKWQVTRGSAHLFRCSVRISGGFSRQVSAVVSLLRPGGSAQRTETDQHRHPEANLRSARCSQRRRMGAESRPELPEANTSWSRRGSAETARWSSACCPPGGRSARTGSCSPAGPRTDATRPWTRTSYPRLVLHVASGAVRPSEQGDLAVVPGQPRRGSICVCV